MEQLIQHVTFFGSPYEYSFIREGLSPLDHIRLERLEGIDPLTVQSDMLIIGHSLPEFDSAVIARTRKPGHGPRSVVSISHGPYPQNGMPSPLDADSDSFHFRWVTDVSLARYVLHLVEDHLFADHYYQVQHRRFLLLVEDEINFASYFIPLIIKELEERTLSLLPGTSDVEQRSIKQNTERPVLLLASNYEQACQFIDVYGDRMVGVISSLGFPKGGVNDLNAGFHLVERVKALPMEIPVVIQTSQREKSDIIRKAGGAFMDKKGPRLLHQLRQYLVDYFGFGDFVFRLPDSDNTIVAKAKTFEELKSCLEWIPFKSFVYHAERRHFSNWLGVHGHLELAERIRPIPPDSGESSRKTLLSLLTQPPG
ncbi:hypothetical protein KKF84_11310 [Myxococcota bacterium]|nr:hypothetical protein [Myxococcota bacterium]MBU1535899.1 hypothetical protein [Myxococcota bacterium]